MRNYEIKIIELPNGVRVEITDEYGENVSYRLGDELYERIITHIEEVLSEYDIE